MNKLNILAVVYMILVASLFIGTISYVLAESSVPNSTTTTIGNTPISMSKMSNMTTLSENESSRS